MIEVRNLTKLYGDHAAVDHLSFTVEDGTIYGFLGPNGAGKSTTMNIMTGYLAPTSGDVMINGHDILEEPEEAKATIGYLPEIPPVYTDMTVYEYLEFAAAVKKIPKKEREDQIFGAIGELGLEEVADRLIRNLSKGYRQRVGFAQAVLGNPETLILDEPTVGLDPKQILEMRELIRSLGKKHTVILSSHILSEVAEVCDRVLIINHGKFVACDTPENLSAAQHETGHLILTVEGNAERALSALSGAGISAEVTDTEGNGLHHLSAPCDDSLAMRRAASLALVNAGCVILEFRYKSTSLENIFLELTADEADEAENDAPEDAGQQTQQSGTDASGASRKEEEKERGTEYEDASGRAGDGEDD